jgi:AcrR family transcriptional regulator
MARPPDPRIRSRLRDQAVDYVLAHGISDLALRPLAKALKTNARMLVYHFGSREGLLREILFGMRERGDAFIQTWLSLPGESHTIADFLDWYWERMSATVTRPIVRLIFEVYALALRNPKEYPGVLEDPVAYWQKLTKKTGPLKESSPAEATLLLAATRGLLLDLCATGDHARTTKALDLLARMVESEAIEKGKTRRSRRTISHHMISHQMTGKKHKQK